MSNNLLTLKNAKTNSTPDNVKFDKRVMKVYRDKAKAASDRNIAFNLTFVSLKNILKAKRCYYTGVVLTDPQDGNTHLPTDRTIDRIDSNKPYEKGNVVACSKWANDLKNKIEGGVFAPSTKGIAESFLVAEKVIKKTNKRIQKSSTETI